MPVMVRYMSIFDDDGSSKQADASHMYTPAGAYISVRVNA